MIIATVGLSPYQKSVLLLPCSFATWSDYLLFSPQPVHSDLCCCPSTAPAKGIGVGDIGASDVDGGVGGVGGGRGSACSATPQSSSPSSSDVRRRAGGLGGDQKACSVRDRNRHDDDDDVDSNGGGDDDDEGCVSDDAHKQSETCEERRSKHMCK